MNLTLFTATGCARCNVAKKFMDEWGVAYEEHDAVGEGKELFGQFYRTHRSAIYRGREGIEFPVLVQDAEIRQGVAVVIAWLLARARLDGFIGRSELSKGWVGGLNVAGGDPAAADELVAVLEVLKKHGLKLQLDTDGRNASVLETLLDKALGDRLVMDLKGPKALYGTLLGAEVDSAEISRAMALAVRFAEYRFETTVAPVPAPGGVPEAIRYLTPEEIAETAAWLKEATGSHRQPYILRLFDPQAHPNERFRSIEKLTSNALLRHRTAARRHQVLTEIETTST
jgi:pyruvate formate lyase activating enzyme